MSNSFTRLCFRSTFIHFTKSQGNKKRKIKAKKKSKERKENTTKNNERLARFLRTHYMAELIFKHSMKRFLSEKGREVRRYRALNTHIYNFLFLRHAHYTI